MNRILFYYVMDEFDFNPIFRPRAFGHLKSAIDKQFPNKFDITYKEGTDTIQQKYDFLLISSLSPDWNSCLNIIRDFRKKNKNAKIILGGQHISQLPELLPNEVDYAIMNEGEVSLPLLIKYILENEKTERFKEISGILFRTPHGELYKKQNTPLDFKDIPRQDYLAQNGIEKIPYLLTSRGCPYRCVFCSSGHFWKKVTFQSAESIADDIKYISDKFPHLKNLSISDDLFVSDIKRLYKLYDILKEKGLLSRFEYTCNVRANLVTDELCELMKKLNIVYCAFGFESASDRVLKLLKPQGNLSAETNRNAALMLHKYGFKVGLSIVVGTPTETKEELLQTYDMTLNLYKNGIVDDLWYNILTPMPATYYWQMALDKNLVKESSDFDWHKISIFADYQNSFLKTFNDWMELRLKRQSIYLNEEYLPEKELLKIMKEKNELRLKIKKEKEEAAKRTVVYQVNLDLNNQNQSQVFIYNEIKENSVVLDVGCACGDLGVVLKNNKNCQVFGFEYSEGSIEIAEKTKAYQKIIQIDLNVFEPEAFSTFYNKFDYIVLGDVLEHLINPQAVLNQLKNYLKPNGYFIISFPNIAHASIKSNLLVDDWSYTEVGILDKTHLRFFTRKSIPIFLAQLGLEMKDLKYTTMGAQGMQPENPWFNLPHSTRKIIQQNPHSFICQYITKVTNSAEKDYLELKNLNENKFIIEKNDFAKIKKQVQNTRNANTKYFFKFFLYKYILRNSKKAIKYKNKLV